MNTDRRPRGRRRGPAASLVGAALALVLALTLAGAPADATGPGDGHPERAATPKKPKAPKKCRKGYVLRKGHCVKRHVWWTPTDTSSFNYPFSSHADKHRIQHRVLTAIANTPRGARIRLATFAFVDEELATALIKAHKRGVGVQLLVNRKDIGKSPPFRRVKHALGRGLRERPGQPLWKASWARTCNRACRGPGGDLHTKIYLFSQVGHARAVSMVGSANLTTMAYKGQWNHMDTVVDRATYDDLLTLFNQMRFDHRPAHPYLSFATARAGAWIFPQPIASARTDPMMRVLRDIDCKAPAGYGFKVPLTKKQKKQRPPPKATRRTVIRIGMYAWFDRRGNYLARAVRQKWNQGCDVKIFYSVLNGTVKKVLYSPTGRGRIPMRRVVKTDIYGNVLAYNHSKYVAISGTYRGRPTEAVWQGSMNFTHLGVISDDLIFRIAGRHEFRAYLQNFRKTWRSRYAKVPIPSRPFSRIAGRSFGPVEEDDPQLGQGTLSGLEED